VWVLGLLVLVLVLGVDQEALEMLSLSILGVRLAEMGVCV